MMHRERAGSFALGTARSELTGHALRNALRNREATSQIAAKMRGYLALPRLKPWLAEADAELPKLPLAVALPLIGAISGGLWVAIWLVLSWIF